MKTSKPSSIRMEFEDNGKLAILTGEHNANLAQLEQALERLVLIQAHSASTFSTVPRSADMIHLAISFTLIIEQRACLTCYI